MLWKGRRVFKSHIPLPVSQRVAHCPLRREFRGPWHIMLWLRIREWFRNVSAAQSVDPNRYNQPLFVNKCACTWVIYLAKLVLELSVAEIEQERSSNAEMQLKTAKIRRMKSSSTLILLAFVYCDAVGACVSGNNLECRKCKHILDEKCHKHAGSQQTSKRARIHQICSDYWGRSCVNETKKQIVTEVFRFSSKRLRMTVNTLIECNVCFMFRRNNFDV